MDNVAEAQGISWDEVWKKDIYEFFNTIAYLKWKSDNIKKQINKWKTSH